MVDFAVNRLFIEDQLGAGFLADPGVGKTFATLLTLDSLISFDHVQRALIVGPTRPLDLVWPQEIKKFGFNFKSQRVDDDAGKNFRNKDCPLEYISRDSLHKAVPHANRWDLVIWDESQGNKTWGTDRSRNSRKLLRKNPTAKRMILTGTPTPNTIADLHAQCYLLDDGAALGRNVGIFRQRYMYQGGWQGRKWIVRGGMSDQILAAMGHLVIRVDAESNLDMPAKIVHDVWVELPKSALKIHKDMKRQYAAELENDLLIAPNAAAAYMKLRQIANGQVYSGDLKKGDRRVEFVHDAKVEALVDLIDELNGKPVLIFYEFMFDAELIQLKLRKSHGPLPIVRGGLKPSETAANIERWLEGKHQVLLVQSQAGAEGLNLQTGGCADVCFFGIPDVAGNYLQGLSRIYRQGGARSVRIHRFVTKDTVEVTNLDRLDGKITDQAEYLQRLKDFAIGA